MTETSSPMPMWLRVGRFIAAMLAIATIVTAEAVGVALSDLSIGLLVGVASWLDGLARKTPVK